MSSKPWPIQGWLIHYLVGIVFAFLLVALCGRDWLLTSDLLQAIAVGLITVLFPILLMQTTMGAGIAASRTPVPWKNRWRSLLADAIFGTGLYMSALVLGSIGA